MGNEGLGDINENGELFTDFCGQNDLVIGGTIFPHKDIHKATWTAPDMSVKNQIDHVAISRRWRRTLTDVRAYRGADAGSDHELLIARLQVRIASIRKSGMQRHPRFDTSRLREEEKQHSFIMTLKNRFQALADLEDGSLEKKWDRVRSTFTSACEEELGYKKRAYKSCLSDETITKIEERRQARQRLNQARTRVQSRTSQQAYSTLNKEVKKGSKRDKRDMVEKLAGEAQRAASRSDMKTLFNITRQLIGRRSSSSKPIRDTNGNTLTKTVDQMNRWRDHFRTLLSGTPVLDSPQLDEGPGLEVNIGPITKPEVLQAIRKLKSGKAPGPDSIPPEALKVSADATADMMMDLLQTVWIEEEVPSEWKNGLIVKIPKKGNLSDCQNWRGIQLLSIPSKILTRIILERIRGAVDAVLREEQAGFRAGRSCTDQIATLRIIIEQSIEWQSPLYINFVDYRKAFDMVDRSTIWSILRHYGIPRKIVAIIRSMYNNTTCQVIHDMELSSPFRVENGVRQGCLLSPLIFSVVVDWVMRTTMDQPRGIQWTMTSRLEDLDFADDACLLSHTFQNIQSKTDGLRTVAGRTGLEVNVKKTKSLRMNAAQDTPIMLGGEAVEDVSKFTYLGSVVSKTGGTEEDIQARIGKARHVFVTLRPIWDSRAIQLNTKLRLFESNVKTVLLYGSETWRHTKRLDNKLQVFINTCLRRILRIRWPERISNNELWRRTKQIPITDVVRQRKWRWIGHILRRDHSCIARHSLDWNPQGKRKRGRPVMTWRRTLAAELKKVRMSWGEAKRLAQDRVRWRAVVLALCPEGDEED